MAPIIYETANFQGTTAIKDITYAKLTKHKRSYDNADSKVRDLADKFFTLQHGVMNQIIPISRRREKFPQHLLDEIEKIRHVAELFARALGEKQHNILRHQCVFSIFCGVFSEFDTTYMGEIERMSKKANSGNQEAMNDIASVHAMRQNFNLISKKLLG